MCSLTIVVPAYNEASLIVDTVQSLDSYMQGEMSGWTYELLIVDDGSTDGMNEVLQKLNNPRLATQRHRVNRGRGAALRTGFDHARGDYIVCLDADLSYSPSHIPRLVAPIVDGSADIVLASPYHPEGSVQNVPWFRAAISKYGNRILSTGVYGKLHTLTSMVRAYRREVIQSMELIADNKDLHLEILQKADMFGFRVVEVPAVLAWRSKDRAKRLKSGWLSSFPLFSMSGTIASHLVHNYVLRPGRTLLIPILALTLVVIAAVLSILGTWIYRFAKADHGSVLSNIYFSLRDTLLNGSLTFAIMLACTAAILIFVSFYFVSQQSKKQFEETYILLARMNERLKRLESKAQD